MHKATTEVPVDSHYYEAATPNSFAERLAVRARDYMFQDFLRFARPQPHETILDVGVSDVIGAAANVIERCYPHPAQITALGLGAASSFQAEFPQVHYRQIQANQKLPFSDCSFDIATSNAVLEHVGSPENQRFFMAELSRVALRVFVTVPYRFFPVEHHTNIPFLHWADTSFAAACTALGKAKWADAENLILMSRQQLLAACPHPGQARIGYTGLRLGPLSSNLYCYLAPQGRQGT